MRIGRWAIKWDGNCWVVGRAITRERNGKLIEEIKSPKYYGRLPQALQSLPDREAAEHWNDCQIIDEFRERMRQAGEDLLAPFQNAVEERREAAESEILGEVDAQHGAS